jgi:hypothetical protein
VFHAIYKLTSTSETTTKVVKDFTSKKNRRMDISNRIKTPDDIENEAMEYPETQENFSVKSTLL